MSATYRTLASRTYSDLKFAISINPPNRQNGFYLLDDLHVVPVAACAGTPDHTACEDNSVCTQGDSCRGGSCGVPIVCDDGNVCTTDSCNAVTGCVFTNSTVSCSDGDVCTSDDRCGGGACTPARP